MQFLQKPPAAVTLVSLCALMSSSAFADEAETVWRLFIADHTAPVVTALDIDAPDQRWQFDVKGPAKLYAGLSGRSVIAVQSDDETVSFLKSGIVQESHGDHADIEITDPALIAQTLEGPRPFHVVTHDQTIAVNFDTGGYVTMLDEGDVVAGEIAGVRFPQARAHHGFATPMGSYFVSSVASTAPVEGDAAPPRVGIQGFDAEGVPVGEMQVCTDLHGEAFSGEYLLAGCKEGVVAVRDGGAAPEYKMLPYPADFPEGHTGTLLGSSSMQVFLGNYGADAVVVIDPTTAPYFSRVALPFSRVDFILDPARPQFAYVLTEDGSVHRLNMLSAEIEQSAGITAPYSMEGHWRDPRPRLAVTGDVLVITDPLAATVRLVDTATLKETGRIAVEGLPYNVIAIGGSGLTH